MSGKDGGWLLPEIIDPPRKSFCIAIPDEPRHVAAFFGALQSLANWWNWQRDPAHNATLVAQVWRAVANNAHTAFYEQECQMYLLRQNPDDACQLEQSIDGGDTWTLAFDFGLCIPPATQILLDQLGTIYNNGWQPSPYAPTDTWIHTNGDTVARSDQRAGALCYAAHQVVGIICESLVRGYQGAYSLVTLAQAVTAICAPFAVILGGAVLGGIAVAIAEIALSVVQDMVGDDIAILQNTDIRETLACVLYEQMSGRPVTAIAFASAFDDDYSCFTADEQRALSLLDAVLSNQEALEQYFIGFSDIVAQSLVAEQATLLPSCSCGTGSWSYCLPLARWWDWSERIDPFEYRCDHQVSGVPEAGQLVTFAGDPVWEAGESNGYRALARLIHFYVPSSTTVTEVRFERVATLGTPNDDDWFKQIRANDQCFSCSSCFGSPIAVGSLTISGDDLDLMVTLLNNGGLTTNMAITQIKISGTGIPLFGACNC